MQRALLTSLSRLLRGVLNGVDDVTVAGAAAEIALNAMCDLFARRLGVAIEKLDTAQDHARRTVTALKTVLLPEAFLHGMKFVAVGEPFDRGDLRAIALHGEHRTTLPRLGSIAIFLQQDSARAADT